MTPEKIISVIKMYEKCLQEVGVPKVPMRPQKTFGELTKGQLLAHAHHLCSGAKEYAVDSSKYGKANRHLTAIQMCLSCAGWYTLEDLMNHNRPPQ